MKEMNEKIEVPKKVIRTQNFSVRFSDREREKLDEFCARKKTTLAAFIRFSTKAVMERAK